MSILAKVVVAVLIMSLGNAQAALIDRGRGLLYDDTLNITWLQDANYAKTSGYDADGRMEWRVANTWAAELSFGGYDDWRLPTATDVGPPGCTWDWIDGASDCGNRVTGSELANMYYSLGRSSDLVVNLQSGGYGYFTATRYAGGWPNYVNYYWYVSFQYGVQSFSGEDYPMYAWAVRDGDVAPVVTAIPEPGTASLIMVSLGLLVGGSRRRAETTIPERTKA